MKVFIFVGEPSGDMHAAALMRDMKNKKNDIQFLGVGGEQMAKEGLNSIIPIEQISVVGFAEVVKRIYLFLKLKKQCQKIMLQEKVDCFIAVDYPGFNIKLATFAKKNNIPVYYYIAPQL
jgi:lipid-A-disaccharide synthase